MINFEKFKRLVSLDKVIEMTQNAFSIVLKSDLVEGNGGWSENR